MSHVDGLSEPDIWTLGYTTLSVDGVTPKIYGRADISAGDITATRLRVLRDDNPFRHAKVVDWPAVTDDDKSLQLEIAQELARLSKLKRNSSQQ